VDNVKQRGESEISWETGERWTACSLQMVRPWGALHFLNWQ